MTELEKITEALLDDAIRMWQKGELTFEEYSAACHFVRRYERSVTSKPWKILFK